MIYFSDAKISIFETVGDKRAKHRINFFASLKLMDKRTASSATKSHCFTLNESRIINRNFALLFSKMIL